MKGVIGGILLAAGILIAGASGLCSLAVFISGLGGSGGGDGIEMLPLVALFGGVPFAIGLGLFFWGRYLIRRAREEARDPAEDF